ncbi:protein kinase domain-containing protein [Rhizobium sp. CIAT894]|nr:protein kinase domain-containing protein [Rhizobium sp. CIAT894]
MLQRGLNDVYLAVGGDSERYVFRLSHQRARGPADVKNETAFLTHLRQTGVPVAAPIPTRDGALFLQGRAPEGMLLRAIDGRSRRQWMAGDALANGKTLALMHNAAKAFSPDGALYRLDLEHTKSLSSDIASKTRHPDTLLAPPAEATKHLELEVDERDVEFEGSMRKIILHKPSPMDRMDTKDED